ncbi:MAG: leucine-rich repeat domain-containing protein [Clostridia bacterium]|nr:leucine-rich repeat domain-containing protein [Clostridia bacterium]
MFLKNITLPDGITSIGEDAFRDCDSLTSIIIPPSVTSIGDGAFYDCNSLRSITFGENSQLTSIGTAAFRDCRSLTSITLPSSVTSTCYYAFYGCSSLTSITIPDSITSIGASAFYGCSSLTSITIPDSVTYISRNAFDGCRSLKSIVIGEKVSSIGTSAFEYCTALDVVYIRSASLLDGFADFTDLGYLLEHCNTVVLYPDSSVPDLISITFPFTEEISYLGTSYTAYSVHEHTWEDCSTHIQCVQDGFRGENCSVCLLTKGENVTAHAFGEWQKHSATQHKRVCACTAVEYDNHNWNSGEITTPATHTTLGVKTFTCSDCGETKTEDVAKLTAHEYGEWQKHDANQHKRVCACAEIDYADHSWNSGVITTPATHLTIGVKTYTCTDCGETKTEDIPKLTAHSYYAWQKHDATQHKHVCACSAVEYEEHNWNSGVITKKPTETEVGVKTFTCTDCGEIKTEEIAKTESNPPSTNSSAGQANSANKDNSSNAKEESLGTGAVIGIVGGSVAVVGGGGFCLYWFVFRKKRLLK